MSFIDCEDSISLIGNSFTSSSGIRGIIEIEHSSPDGDIIIYNNTFTHNSGLYRSNVLNIASRY